MNVVLGCRPKRSPRPKTRQHPATSAEHSQRLVSYHNASQKQAKEKKQTSNGNRLNVLFCVGFIAI